jgi:hypothetical protein
MYRLWALSRQPILLSACALSSWACPVVSVAVPRVQQALAASKWLSASRTNGTATPLQLQHVTLPTLLSNAPSKTYGKQLQCNAPTLCSHHSAALDCDESLELVRRNSSAAIDIYPLK